MSKKIEMKKNEKFSPREHGRKIYRRLRAYRKTHRPHESFIFWHRHKTWFIPTYIPYISYLPYDQRSILKFCRFRALPAKFTVFSLTGGISDSFFTLFQFVSTSFHSSLREYQGIDMNSNVKRYFSPGYLTHPKLYCKTFFC